MTNTLRAIIWAAVSTKPQAQKDSNTQQIEDARKLAADRDWLEVGVLEVPGHTREYIFLHDAANDIPAYQGLIDLCNADSFDLLICRGRDRLGRSDALIAQVEAIVTRSGASIYSMTMPAEPSTDESQRDTWLSAVERAKAQSELIEFRRRYQAGMTAKAKRGVFPSGLIAYGYRRIKHLKPEEVEHCEDPRGKSPDDLVIYEPEARWVRHIYDEYLAGKAMRAIVDNLNAMGAPAPSNVWHYAIVAKLLRNPVYAGRVRWGELTTVNRNGRRQRVRRDAPLVDIVGNHTPIIEPSIYQQVQDLRSRRAQVGGRAAGSPRVFSGKLRCAICGGNMSVGGKHARGKKPYINYACKAARGGRAHSCTNLRMIAESKLCDAILAEMRTLADDPTRFNLWRSGVVHRPQTEELRDGLQRRLADCERSVRFWDRQGERGLISDNEWYEQRQRLHTERDSIQAALAELESTAKREVIIPDIDQWRESVAILDKATLRPFLLRFVDYITFDGESIDIHFI